MYPHPARAIALGTALAATVVLTACGSDGASSAPTYSQTSAAPVRGQVLAVTTMDNMFMGPSTLSPGLTTIQLHNQGPAPHQIQLLRLDDGVSADQALAAAHSGNPGALLSLATVAGGANAVAAGHDQQVTVDLSTGTYLEVCFISDPDGVSHVAKGMVSVLNVSGTARPATPPIAVATAQLRDFAFDLPKPFDGHGTLQVINDGPQPHELTLLALAPGKTLEDVVAFFAEARHSGPPPFSDAGGLGAIGAGQTAWVDLDLAPGEYAAICLVPDPATGKPHLMLGMVAAFTVG